MIEKVIRKESIYLNDYTGDTDIIQKHIDHILTFDKGRVVSNRGGYQSNNITFGFDDIINFAIESLASIDFNCQLSNFWLNINDGNSFNLPHIHATEEAWSVVYYHKVCCEKATLNFHSLVPTIISEQYLLHPKEKMMVFFKANIPHSVSSWGGENHERITLAFNFRKI